MKKVYVVTSVELGWDCIVGVFDPDEVTQEKLENRFRRHDGYFIFENTVESNLNDWE